MSDLTLKRINEITSESSDIAGQYFAMDSEEGGTKKVNLSDVLDNKYDIKYGEKINTVNYVQTADNADLTKIGEFTKADGTKIDVSVPYVPQPVDEQLNEESNNPVTNAAISAKFADEAAARTAGLNGKVDVESGKGLSTNDYTNVEKTKLTNLGLESSYKGEIGETINEDNYLLIDCTPTSGAFTGQIGEIVAITLISNSESIIEIPSEINGIMFSFENIGDYTFTHLGEVENAPIWYEGQTIVLISNGGGQLDWIESPYATEDLPGITRLTSDTQDIVSNNKAVTPAYVTELLANNGNEYMTKAEMFDAIYPIGSVYLTFEDSNPSSLFGGEWVKITEGQFLISSGQTFLTGSTGGSKTQTLTRSNLPKVNIPTSSNGAHSHEMARKRISAAGSATFAGPYNPGEDTGTEVPNTSTVGAHTHTVTLNDSATQTPISIMPPYLVVNMWRKTQNATNTTNDSSAE